MNKRFFASLVFFSAMLLANVSAQAASVNWTAYASAITAICTSGCSLSVPDREFGGGMDVSVDALVDDSRGRAEAVAQLSGSSFLPNLGASAASNPGGNVAQATAVGVQSFTNTTGAAWEILLDINLTATVSGDADAEARVGVFLADALNDFSSDFGTQAFEINSGDLIGSDTPGNPDDDARSFLFKTSGGERVNDTLSFTIPTGATFIVWAGLQATGEFGGSADALNTLKLDFIDDTGQVLDFGSSAAVMPELNPVPLPAGVWLFLSGIAAVAGLTRRRQRT